MSAPVSPLVLLHGALGDVEQCAPLQAALDWPGELLRVEFEGHGRTASPGRPFRIEHFAENVLQAMDGAGVESATFFGYSMGGYVALWLARFHPARVQRVVTLGTKLRWTPEGAERELAGLDPAQMRAKVPKFVALLEARHPALGFEGIVAATAEMMRMMGEAAPLGDEDLHAIAVPVRLTVGDRDATVSIDECLAARRLLPLGELEVHPATPHPFERAPVERLARSVREFLG